MIWGSYQQQKVIQNMDVEIRAAGDPISLLRAVRSIVRDLDPDSPLGNDPHKPGVGERFRPQCGGWLERSGPIGAPREAQQGARGGIHEYHHLRSVKVCRGAGERRWPEPSLARRMTKPSLHITTAGLFPLFQPDLPPNKQRKDLASGLGVTVFDGPDGHGFLRVATMDKPSIL
jgi:hypothetical protein